MSIEMNKKVTRFEPCCQHIRKILKNELIANDRLYLVASENILSPFARLPFLLDYHFRYFLNDMKRFGKWYFPEGSSIGEIEQEILDPLLGEMAQSKYVNTRPISGMTCMTVALAGLTKLGDTIFTIPLANGGHASTTEIAKRLGLKVHFIPFKNPYDIDFDILGTMLKTHVPRVIYIDQSTFLFPIKLQFIRNILDTVSPKTILYYDSSHDNGLILGQVSPNPLANGAHCFGGSTHKTLPGPHKGFLASNDHSLIKKIHDASYLFISHHHPASMLSLLFTLLEMKYCKGQLYAQQILLNAKAFAKALVQNNFFVAAQERSYTANHQVWAYPLDIDCRQYFDTLIKANIITTCFDNLPGINQSALRLSVAEVTRLGAKENDMADIATIMKDLARNQDEVRKISIRIKRLTKKLTKPHYCFDFKNIEHIFSNFKSEKLKILLEAIFYESSN